jgi:hypothetical protein
MHAHELQATSNACNEDACRLLPDFKLLIVQHSSGLYQCAAACVARCRQGCTRNRPGLHYVIAQISRYLQLLCSSALMFACKSM